jgi:hypothetical protein
MGISGYCFGRSFSRIQNPCNSWAQSGGYITMFKKCTSCAENFWLRLVKTGCEPHFWNRFWIEGEHDSASARGADAAIQHNILCSTADLLIQHLPDYLDYFFICYYGTMRSSRPASRRGFAPPLSAPLPVPHSDVRKCSEMYRNVQKSTGNVQEMYRNVQKPRFSCFQKL